MSFLEDVLKIGFLTILCVAFILLSFALSLSVMYLASSCLDYYLDESFCKAYYNHQLVYDGRCHFISTSENKLTIFEDALLLKPIKQYSGGKVEIE